MSFINWILQAKMQNLKMCNGDFLIGCFTCFLRDVSLVLGFPGGSDGKESTCNAGDLSSIPGSGRSPRDENDHPLQYFCLENSMGRGAWWATVHKSVTLPPPQHFKCICQMWIYQIPKLCTIVFYLLVKKHEHWSQTCLRHSLL